MQKYIWRSDGMFRDADGYYYEAADVDAELASKRATIEAAVKGIAQRDARIAELEKALQLIYGLTDSGMRDGDEARAIAKRVLMGRES